MPNNTNEVPSGQTTHTLEDIDAGVSEVENAIGNAASLAAAIAAAAESAAGAAVNALDVSSKGGSGKYIKSISESDGKINATAETMDTEPTSGSDKAITSGAVFAMLLGIFGPGTSISGTSDTHYNLDNLKITGAFSINSAGATAYIDNKPNDTDITSVRALVFVFEFYGSRYLQIYVPNRTSNAHAYAEFYLRCYGTSWSNWRGIYGTQIQPAALAQMQGLPDSGDDEEMR